MRHMRSAAAAVVVGCALAQPMAAQNGERAVPILQAPFHVPVFTNEYVTLLKIDGGVLAEVIPGQADRGMSLRAGDFFWQEAGTTRAIKNTGATRLEFVEFELK